MAEKKKPESMLTRQRRLLREQRAKKAAAKRAKQASTKSLPPKGKSTASSTRARIQRGARRDAMAKKQLENFGRAFKKTLKQGAAQSKLNKAAKGTKGTTVRTAQGKGELVKRTSNLPASQRVEKVKVKVDQPKQLPPGKPKQLPAAKTPKALPSKSSAVNRRADAKTKADKAAKGTRGTRTRVTGGRGLPKQTPKLPPASNVKDAVRSVGKNLKPVSPALKGIARVAGPLALGISAYKTAEDLIGSFQRGEGIPRLLSGGVKNESLKPNAKAKSANRSERGAGSRARVNRKKEEPTPSKSSPSNTNRRGRSVNKPTTVKRGMSNIPPKEGPVNNPNFGKPGKVSKKVSKEVKPADKVSSSPPKTKSTPKPLAKKSATSTYKKHGSDLHVGRYKTLKEHRAAVEAKKKKKNQSAAIKAGWQGNRNY